MDYLTTQNTYKTPNRKISWLTQKFTGWVFYTKLIYIVWKSSRLAKKGEYPGEKWAQSSLYVLKALESVGVNFEIENIEALKNLDSPCVFVSNHMSVLETFILPCIIQPYRNVTFIVKKSLVEYPLFKHVMRSRNPIVVGRTNPKEDFKNVLEKGQELLKENTSIIVFPQTTRSLHLDTKKFNTIGGKLAKHAGVPIVPIALKTDAWGIGCWLKDFGKIYPAKTVRICFGDPLYVTGNGKEEHASTIQFITEKLNAWV